MNDNFAIQLFEGKKVRIVWDEEQEKYYFSVTDIVQVLTDQPTPRGASTYWAVLKKRLKEEGADELITNCKQLKLPAADGKKYKTDIASPWPLCSFSGKSIRLHQADRGAGL